jgi:hypothetical protein
MARRRARRISLAGAALLVLACPLAAANAAPSDPGREQHHHELSASPLSPLLNIYVLQYSYRFAPRTEVMAGASYMNIQFDFGETRAPGIIVGLRHYLWRGLHFEYQLWPAYDWFYEKYEDETYEGFELWNEARLGYRFDIPLSDALALTVTPQWAVGFGLYMGEKPERFKDKVRLNPFFGFPLLFVGLAW